MLVFVLIVLIIVQVFVFTYCTLCLLQALEALTHHSHQLALDVCTDGCVDALAVWFDLHLTEGLTVSTQPNARGCWEQAIFPVMMKTASPSGTCKCYLKY